ncbi:MAG TPA: crotonase/enoyl-CoA hydratase family protein [Candidatus Angelobacter sp.]|nr:crotonase/enoyl-CoA hydratase family protein [Candidatus Angelobacter sp.]
MTKENDSVLIERDGNLAIVTINRPQARNAVNSATAQQLAQAFEAFDRDDSLRVAILTGSGNTFCAGFDLKEVATGEGRQLKENETRGPMGPTWMFLSKPVLAAVEGYAVAGGFELALWCDLRIAARDAIFGVFNRRFGVPLIDLGTVRLPRLIGQSHALDLILTGRGVSGEEALRMGVANRLVEPGKALEASLRLAYTLAEFPQQGLQGDRMSAYEQWPLSWKDACHNELRHGLAALNSGEAVSGASRFASGAGRHGQFSEEKS